MTRGIEGGLRGERGAAPNPETHETEHIISAERKNDLVEKLKDRLREAFRSRHKDAAQTTIAKLTGDADGYMQALIDAGIMSEPGAKKLTGEARRDVMSEMQREFSDSMNA